MFFRRQKGQYRETDRVTRYKLVKSGKHWLRASTSLFGLFKVLRGGVDTTQVTTEVVENQTNQTITGLDIIRAIAATGAVLGGAVATQTKVFANEAVSLEKTLDSSDALATHDTVVLGKTAKVDAEDSASLSNSVSESVSSSESTSASQSVSASTSASMSASTSASVSASTSTSVSSSQLMVHSEDNSVATSTASVETAGQSESASAENQVVSQGLPNSNLSAPVLDSAQSATGLKDKNAELTSLAGVNAGALSSVEVSAKKNEEDRKKLAKISAEMGEYLAKAADLPDTSSAILKVKSAITEIESALKEPNADLGEVIKSATSARNSIANAVLRATSGQRDSRNGQAMAVGENLRGLSPIAVNNHTKAQLGQGSYSSSNREVVWTIKMHSQSPLNYAGLIAQVDRNTTITRVLFNGEEMEKRGGSGNEYVFNKRHDLNGNLEATILVYATVNNRSNAATLNAQVATSSQPFTSANTTGNYSSSMSSTVTTGEAGYNRAASKPPTISLPADVTYYNDDSISKISMPMRDDKGLKKLEAGPNNTIITGLSAPDYPRSRQGKLGDFGVYNQWGKLLYYPKLYTVNMGGTIGRDNGTWKPFATGAHILEYIVTDSDNQSNTARMTVNIKGFNERQNPVSGDTVTVNNPSSLSETERAQILANFKSKNATILSSTDYVKGSEGGKEITVSNTGEITITYRDNTVDVVQANVRAETVPPVPAVTVTRDGQTIPATQVQWLVEEMNTSSMLEMTSPLNLLRQITVVN